MADENGAGATYPDAATTVTMLTITITVPRRCESRGCPWRRCCPVHEAGRRHPRGYAVLDRLIRARPLDGSRRR